MKTDIPLLAQSASDPDGLNAHAPGAKLDKGKAPIFDGVLQYFPRALTAIAELSDWGANRYSWEGWRSVASAFRRYSNAMGRHILKEKTEGLYDLDARNDPDHPAEILHATQVAWNALARLDKLLEEMENEVSRKGASEGGRDGARFSGVRAD